MNAPTQTPRTLADSVMAGTAMADIAQGNFSQAEAEQYIDNVLNRAAGHFFTIRIRIGQWKGVKRNSAAEADAIKSAGVSARDGAALRATVGMFGAHQSLLNEVNKEFRRIRDYMYKTTEAVSDLDDDATGERLFPITMLPRIKAELKTMIEAANAKWDDFLTQYDALRDEALRNMPTWLSPHDFPTVDEVRRKMYVRVGKPQPFVPKDVSRVKLSPELMAEVSLDVAAPQLRELNNAKARMLEEAEKFATRVHTQLTKGSRLYDTLITDAQMHGEFVRDMGQAFNDVQMQTCGEDILKHIASVTSTDVWKHNETQREQSATVAKRAATSLRNMRQDSARFSNPVDMASSQPVTGDSAAEMWE